MTSSEPIEHFCTLFDLGFVLQGLALYESIGTHSRRFHLWIVCMDDRTMEVLAQLRLANVTLLALRDVENDALRSVRPERTHGEYCWTITPFVCSAVLDRATDAARVTYVDADVMFFDDPRILLDEFTMSGRDVLITEHAYAPEYEQSATSGRFCVQFITFTRSPGAALVAAWWQDRCVEWCFARFEDGKFGDQKYLDSWPDRFRESVHISQQRRRTLAPWNVRYVASLGPLKPVFFHFHGLRRFGPHHIRLYWGYSVGRAASALYAAYMGALRRAARRLDIIGSSVTTPPTLSFEERLFMWRPRRHARFARL